MRCALEMGMCTRAWIQRRLFHRSAFTMGCAQTIVSSNRVWSASSQLPSVVALVVGWQQWLILTKPLAACASPCSQIWYGVPAAAAAALDAAMRDALPHLFDKDHLLLHKLITMLSPAQLAARGVPVCRAVQVCLRLGE